MNIFKRDTYHATFDGITVKGNSIQEVIDSMLESLVVYDYHYDKTIEFRILKNDIMIPAWYIIDSNTYAAKVLDRYLLLNQ